MTNIAVLVTMSDKKENDSSLKRSIREKQYMYSLSRVFSFGYPVYGVLSEIDETRFLPKHYFPFKKLLEIPNTTKILGNVFISTKEYYCIKQLIKELSSEPNDLWILKISGRYLVKDDSFINKVKNSDRNTVALIKKCEKKTDGKDQMYTFLFAIRLKCLRHMFELADIQNGTNIELHIYNFLMKFYKDQINFVDILGVICNVAEQEIFKEF